MKKKNMTFLFLVLFFISGFFLAVPKSYGVTYTGTATIYWGSVDQGLSNCLPDQKPPTAGIEVVLLSGTTASPIQSRYVFDNCSAARNNSFSLPQTNGLTGYMVNNTNFLFKAVLPPITNGLIMKVIPLYNSTIVGLQGTAVFPPQGKIIESVGISGDTKRKIIYYESYPQIPNEIFPYAILSQ